MTIKQERNKHRKEFKALREKWLPILKREYPSHKNVNKFNEAIKSYLY